MEKMRGLWLDNRKLAYREDIPLPTIKPGEALIRLRLAGICATDLEMLKGYYPFSGVLGHEFVGEVVSIGDDTPAGGAWIGTRVVGEINVTCGECSNCRGGRPNHCDRRSVLGILNHHGVFAEYLVLPIWNLHAVPEGLPDEAAVFTEPLAAALEISDQVHIEPNDKTLLIGAGRLGQLVARILALHGCDLHVVARHPRQIQLLESIGIHTFPVEEISARHYDLVVEATGSEQGFHVARQAVRPRGTIILKSTYAGDVRVDFSSIVVDEINLVGSRCGPFQPALRMMESGLVDPRPLIDACYPLEAGVVAHDQAGQPGIMKVLLEPALCEQR